MPFAVSHDDRLTINLDWLIKLRWAAVVGQVATISVAAILFQVELALTPLLVMVAVTALTNLALEVAFRRRRRRGTLAESPRWRLVVGIVVLLDLMLLTGLLYLTGGPANPFFVFYFVNLSLAALVLPAAWTWPLTGAAVLMFAALFYDHTPVPALEIVEPMRSVRASGKFTLPQQGLLAAFATCAVVIVYFMTRLTHELRLRESAQRRAESNRARSEKLEALGTLAAGAAHELSTPLSTIAVVAKELEADAARLKDDALSEDVRLIRSEVNRCRTILDHLAADAGQAAGEAMANVSVGELLETVLGELPDTERVDVLVDDAASVDVLHVPRHAAAQALRGLVKNALDAAAEPRVELRVARHGDSLQLTVRDQGPGMPPEVLARAGEPFFTTKQPGRGLGLGIFLARSVVERLGGRLEIASSPGHGTRVEVTLPLEGDGAAG